MGDVVSRVVVTDELQGRSHGFDEVGLLDVRGHGLVTGVGSVKKGKGAGIQGSQSLLAWSQPLILTANPTVN
jgi:hypothetical protein